MNITDENDYTGGNSNAIAYRHFSKALLATLCRVYADDIENWESKEEFQKYSTYFHFFKNILANDPGL